MNLLPYASPYKQFFKGYHVSSSDERIKQGPNMYGNEGCLLADGVAFYHSTAGDPRNKYVPIAQ